MATSRAVVGLLSSAVVSMAFATAAFAPPASASSCDSWQGPTSGTQLWSVPGNWSAGLPSSSSDVCIVLPGTYTVDLATSGAANTITIGGASGTQTLLVDGTTTGVSLSLSGAAASTIGTHGVLNLHDTGSGFAMLNGASGSVVNNSGLFTTTGTGQPVYLRAPLANLAAGTATFAAADTTQDSTTLTTNAGAFAVSLGGALSLSTGSSFTNSAGTLAVSGAFTENSGTFTAAGGALTGNPVVLTGGTLDDSGSTGMFDVESSTTLNGSIPSGQTVRVNGVNTPVALNVAGATTVFGTLLMIPTGSGYSMVSGAGSLTIASGGAMSTSGSGQPVYLRVPITNNPGGAVSIATPDTRQDSTTLTTNSAAFTVTATGGLSLTGNSSFTNAAGTLSLAGSFVENSGTFTASGGTESGIPAVLTGGTLADSAGTGAFAVRSSTTLTGPIPTGQTVTVDGVTTPVQLNLPGPTSVHGTLAMTPTANGYSMITGLGSLTLLSGGVLTTSGSGQPVYLRVPITNKSGGSISIATPDTHQDSTTLTTNSAAFTVTATGALSLTGNSSFTNAAGTLTVAGSFIENSGTFTASGGAEAGNPVVITGGTLADSAGTGAVAIRASATLTGSIPSGQTVTIDGVSTSVQASVPNAVSVHGTLGMTPSPNGYAMLSGAGSLTVSAGGVLTTSGSGQTAYVRVPITNNSGGAVSIGTPDTRQDSGTADSNSGTFAVADGGHLSLSGGSTLTNAAAGTLGVTVNGTSSVSSGISGPGITLAGTMGVTTVGATPALGSTFTPITGPVSGTFSALSFGPFGYSVSYPAGSVMLTTTPIFTAASTAFTPHKAIPTGPIQVATIGAANNGTGTYSATVNWGDATAPTPATVNITGSTGTVTSPGHTYTQSGPFTVTTTISNTDGTTITTSTNVVVPALAVTHVSPNSGSTTGGTLVRINGTGFTGATAVNFGPGAPGTGLTVVSDTQLTVTSPAHVAGKIHITVTTPGGTSPKVSADKFTFKLPPIITSLTPKSGRAAGGTTVTITGTGFTGATAVAFGSAAATSFTVVSDTHITAVAPAHAAGLVNVRVTTNVATSATTSKDHYTFKPPPTISAVSPASGRAAGGTTVTITGTGFTGTTKVAFTSTSAANFTVVSDTKITVRSPAHTMGRTDVRVTAAGGTSAKVTADHFRYV